MGVKKVKSQDISTDRTKSSFPGAIAETTALLDSDVISLAGDSSIDSSDLYKLRKEIIDKEGVRIIGECIQELEKAYEDKQNFKDDAKFFKQISVILFLVICFNLLLDVIGVSNPL